MVGELGLDGSLRPISGVLPTALACGVAGRQLVVPEGNSLEAGLAENTTTWHADHLLGVCRHIVGRKDMQLCNAHIKEEGVPKKCMRKHQIH